MHDKQVRALLRVDLKVAASKIPDHARIAQFVPCEMHLRAFVFGFCVVEALQAIAARTSFIREGFVISAVAARHKSGQIVRREIFCFHSAAKTALQAVIEPQKEVEILP